MIRNQLLKGKVSKEIGRSKSLRYPEKDIFPRAVGNIYFDSLFTVHKITTDQLKFRYINHVYIYNQL